MLSEDDKQVWRWDCITLVLCFVCICNRDPIAILLSEDDRQARRWGLSHFGMSLSVSPAVHMESANVTAAMSFSTTKSVLCQPCTLSLWH